MIKTIIIKCEKDNENKKATIVCADDSRILKNQQMGKAKCDESYKCKNFGCKFHKDNQQ